MAESCNYIPTLGKARALLNEPLRPLRSHNARSCKIQCMGTVGCCCRSCCIMNEAFTTLDEMCCKTIDVYSPHHETQTNTLKSVVASSTSSRCSLKLSWRLITLMSILHPFISTSTPTLLELNSENFRNCCLNGAVDFEPHKGVCSRQTEP